MKYLNLTLLFCLISVICTAQKPPIDHSVYDSWKSVKSLKAPNNGHILVYNIAPQEGDSKLVFHNTRTGQEITVPRATHSILPGSSTAAITPDGTRAIATIKPLFEQTREAKIKKTKKDDMPKDTLAIIDLTNGNITKFPACASFKAPETLGNTIAFQKAPKRDTLFILDISTCTVTDTILNVGSFSFSPDGTLLTYVTKPKKEKKEKKSEADSTATKAELAKEELPALYAYNMATGESVEILSGPKGSKINLPSFFKDNSMAFSANTDTAKTSAAKNNLVIYLYNPATRTLVEAVKNSSQGMNAGWVVSPNGRIAFSENGSRLFFGTAPKPMEKDTTIPDFEKPQLDIWGWQDDYIQPGQLLTLNEDLRQSYTAYINIDAATLAPANGGKVIQLGDLDVPEINVPDGGNADYVLINNDKRFRLESQWNYIHPEDVYMVNIKDGSRKLVYEGVYYGLTASNNGAYYAIYDMANKCWLLHDMATGKLTNLTSELPYQFYAADYDMPSLPKSAGGAMWLDDNSAFFIQDIYDVWQIDPTGANAPKCVTEGYGRENKISFTPVPNLIETPAQNYGTGAVRFSRTISAKYPVFFNAYNNVNKQNGIYTLDITKKKAKLVKLQDGPYTYRNFTYIKAEKGKLPVYAFLRGNFENPMDVWITKDNFKSDARISDISPEQKNYNWGTAELVSWYTMDSIKADGVLYKPENFDPNKKYPVIIYFYEKSSNTLYRYSQPAPSRSTVNIPYFVSNGYIVFVPDIYYFDGHPGQSAMRSIMPGVEMLEQYPWIDSENMAIQGQSWGGYQVAYMITQTNKFKAAGSGAPVANMTSAYGGVRWGSGITRQFQYEQTQSRIGKDLWSGFDLYVENSPLFFLPNVTTPVLIMHNDQDGAVPWYQGIELFAGLKRLGKVAWLLQYNNEEHNLEERRNAKDLSIRLAQFFDHYLKGAPMPKWMKYGRPAVEKEYDLGYELVKE